VTTQREGTSAGEKIPLPARLMALIDVYDALISERPYKKAFTHEEAIKIIADGKGTHFDPVLTDLFLSVADKLIVEANKNIQGENAPTTLINTLKPL